MMRSEEMNDFFEFTVGINTKQNLNDSYTIMASFPAKVDDRICNFRLTKTAQQGTWSNSIPNLIIIKNE